MSQLSLFDVEPKKEPQRFRLENRTLDGALACAFGEPWMGPHPLCAAEVERACAAFARDVAAGVYDAQGYMPNERKAQQRKAAR